MYKWFTSFIMKPQYQSKKFYSNSKSDLEKKIAEINKIDA